MCACVVWVCVLVAETFWCVSGKTFDLLLLHISSLGFISMHPVGTYSTYIGMYVRM